ncbi:ceramidase domain-containing protein [Mangrovicella endophytica]|uniref:ceramidase domain-containing protein n=1 Tax=Mangrovicella endophytica TaxID=2066697 RepID=UPI000C9DD852|nr:ceramidase domain-containing protein [Mangrovicella endophytica]
MNWTASIDNYCERVGTAFWAEPLNAVSNAAFIIAALVGLVIWLRSGRGDRWSGAMVAVVFVVGVGSFLFHTFANRWSSLADVIPIAVFIYGYFALALRRFVGLSPLTTAFATGAFLIASFALAPFLEPLVGSSSGYVPALLALLGIGLWLVAHRRRQGIKLVAAGIIFAASLGWRIVDMPLCEEWPAGTHFLWHIFNAVTLGLLLIAAIRNAADRADKAARPVAV